MSSQGTYESEAAAGAETNGWIAFAAFILMLNGFFSVLWGLAAIINGQVLNVGGHGVTVLDFTTWGWVNLILGVLMAVVGLGLFTGSGVSRWLAIGLVMLNALAQFGAISAFPLWALLVIALDVVIMYQLLVNWRPPVT